MIQLDLSSHNTVYLNNKFYLRLYSFIPVTKSCKNIGLLH